MKRMIVDTISHISLYLPPGIRMVLEPFISQLRSDLPVGRCWIQEPNIFAQISSYQTKSAHEGRLEAHQRYVDMQILLEGTEMIVVTPVDGLIPDTDYDEQDDIRFYKSVSVPAIRLLLTPGSFALFFPQDAHCPQLTPSTGVQDVKKAVIKIDTSLLMSLSHGQ